MFHALEAIANRDSILFMIKRFWQHIIDLAKRLISLHDPPHAIAGGVAIGIFFGFSPLFGLKTVLALVLAWIFRCSPVSAVIAVTLHDIMLPLYPIVLTLQYDVGYFVYHHRFPSQLGLRHVKLVDVFKWTTFLTVGWPMLLGSAIFGVPLSLISYFLTLGFIKKYRQRRDAKHRDIDSQECRK
ncbi:MAG: DUF2062 domain-containing protein [Verrucomicrobia bacterium]|nr:MAG: DUF2062 domain-containing protein [Verrucomicrobiota bacterium]